MNIAIGPLIGEYGGVAQHIRNIIKYSKNSFRPITSSPFSIRYSDKRFKLLIARFANKCRLRVDIYGMSLSRVLSSQFDIVHLHGHPWWPEIYWRPKHRYAKYVHTIHQVYLKEDSLNEKAWRYRKWLNNLMFESCRKSDVVISVAKWQQKLLLREGIKSVHIANGVNVSECEKANPITFREKYGISVDFFLFAGRIDKYKRPELFVELAKKMPHKLFVMIGRDCSLSNLIAYMKTKVPENIICLGELPRRDVLDAFAASRVYVLPSKNDTFPTTLMEAMACKKTVIAAANAGPKEIVTHGNDGFLFEPDSIDDLYEKSSIAWDCPELGLKAYEKVRENFDWTVLIKQVDEVYKELIEA